MGLRSFKNGDSNAAAGGEDVAADGADGDGAAIDDENGNEDEYCGYWVMQVSSGSFVSQTSLCTLVHFGVATFRLWQIATWCSSVPPRGVRRGTARYLPRSRCEVEPGVHTPESPIRCKLHHYFGLMQVWLCQ